MLMIIFDVLIIPLETLFLYYFLKNNELKVSSIHLALNYLFYTIFVFVLNLFEVDSVVRILCAIFGISILLYISYQISILKLISMMSLYLIILGVSELFSIGIIMLLSQDYNLNDLLNTPYELCGTILAKTLTFIVLVICKKYQIKNSYDKEDAIIIFLPLILGVCIVIFFVYTIFNLGNSNEEFTNMLIIVPAIVMLETICNLLLIEHYLVSKHKVHEYEKMQYIKKSEKKYYDSKRESEMEIRKIYHDLKNYQIYLDSKNAKKDYELDALLKPLKRYETFIETNNEILNTILNEKILVAEEQGITVNCLIDFSQGYFIEPLDICAIFGNLLDNAIEYYDNMRDLDSKYIEVRSNIVNEVLVIRIVNYIYTEIKVEKGIIQTRKKDKSLHGIGLLSVKESVEKYSGNFIINVTDSEYIATIFFPIGLDS